MGDLASNRATFRTKFELEKRHHSHSDIRPKAVKSQPKMELSSPSMQMEEIIKHMKHLPSYLQNGKPNHDRALSFGVMDWGRLQKWQHHQHKKHEFVKTNKCSSSSSNSSLFSTDGSSPQSSKSQSCSPARSKVHRLTLQSHFKASPNQDFTPPVKLCSENVEKFQSFEDPRKSSKSFLDIKSRHTPPSSCSKGKLKIQDESLKISDPCPFQSEVIKDKNSRNKTPERKNTTFFKISDVKTSNYSVIKSRSVSPLRRFSFSSKSATERPESPVSIRGHSSPLRRLLDPIFPSKSHEEIRTKAKAKLDFGIRVDDVSSSRKQALFQTTVKNDRLLFTFAVENNDILAATLTSLTSSGKNDNGNSIYTFFTVHEVKKKNVKWLPQGSKSKDYGYVPNVTAQMKVSKTWEFEFVLFSVNPNVQPQEELEAIVVKFSRNQERFNTTVVLPGGTHGVPSKGEPSSLTDRWRSGGVCDCGGWDEGCKITTLTNHNSGAQFELFIQGEVGEKRPMFILSPLKDGIFSVEYNSSLSALHAFSICISVIESRKGIRTRVYEEVPVTRIKKNVIS